MAKSSPYNFLLLHFEALNFTCLLLSYTINNYNVPSFERKMKEHDLMLFQKQDGFFSFAYVS